MLKLLNRLKPFFEDTHREYSVREIGRIVKISPPTASTYLKKAEKDRLLLCKKQGIYIYYRANRESSFFRDLARAYWRLLLKRELEDYRRLFLFKEIILFGSLVKVENTFNSDIDLFIDIDKRNIDLRKLEKKLKRKIQVHFRDALKNENLKKNIENGELIE